MRAGSRPTRCRHGRLVGRDGRSPRNARRQASGRGWGARNRWGDSEAGGRRFSREAACEIRELADARRVCFAGWSDLSANDHLERAISILERGHRARNRGKVLDRVSFALRTAERLAGASTTCLPAWPAYLAALRKFADDERG